MLDCHARAVFNSSCILYVDKKTADVSAVVGENHTLVRYFCSGLKSEQSYLVSLPKRKNNYYICCNLPPSQEPWREKAHCLIVWKIKRWELLKQLAGHLYKPECNWAAKKLNCVLLLLVHLCHIKSRSPWAPPNRIIWWNILTLVLHTIFETLAVLSADFQV